ncbi:MAG: Flp pilus assembly complex ATPase component TadA [Propionibacteriaceae bacterium]|jgi:Flp pilus assembly CpaF family ATPase|nr:Flp pilus assembly complex ATPase component TadA [Propionibacteriaceae bacterium]
MSERIGVVMADDPSALPLFYSPAGPPSAVPSGPGGPGVPSDWSDATARSGRSVDSGAAEATRSIVRPDAVGPGVGPGTDLTELMARIDPHRTARPAAAVDPTARPPAPTADPAPGSVPLPVDQLPTRPPLPQAAIWLTGPAAEPWVGPVSTEAAVRPDLRPAPVGPVSGGPVSVGSAAGGLAAVGPVARVGSAAVGPMVQPGAGSRPIGSASVQPGTVLAAGGPAVGPRPDQAPAGPTDELDLSSDDRDFLGLGTVVPPPVQIDWGLVARLRSEASERLSSRIGADRIDRLQQQRLGRTIIHELLEDQAAQAAASGQGAWDRNLETRIGQAIFDALFRLGRLQPLVDDDGIENIVIVGHENVWLEYADGRLLPGPPVADSDDELIDFLVFLASRSEVNARAFSEAEPRLHLRLDGGSRLAAAAWVTPRPSVVIRRHRLRDVLLADLVESGCLTEVAASFLAAAVKARLSIVVCGVQGAGKTTLVRALCAEIPPSESIGTFETEYELHLHEMPQRHPVVHAWEARPGSGEIGAQGRRAGEFTVDDALYDSFRFNLSRQIVGEVRGREVLAMIKAMQSGAGSLSTTHADSAEGAVRKLITCAMEAGPHVTQDYATRAIAQDIDLIVHVQAETERLAGGGFRKRRWLSQIIRVGPGEAPLGYATSTVFEAGPDQRLAQPVRLPDELRQLARHGFRLNDFQAHQAGAGL